MSRSLSISDPQGILEPLETPALVCITEFGMTPNLTPDIDSNLPLYFEAGDFIDSPLPKSKTATEQLGIYKRWIFLGPGTEFFNFDDGPSKSGIKIHTRNGAVKLITPELYSEIVQFIRPNGLFSLYSQIPFWASSRQKRLRNEASKNFIIDNPLSILFTSASSEKNDSGLFMQVGEITPELHDQMKEIINQRPKHLPRALLFDGHPSDIRTAIELGFDILIPYFPIYYARKGHAFIFDFDDSHFDNIDLDLKSREFEHDHQPVVNQCDCRLCHDHMRSYIHHLLNVHEMLATTLLIEHNFRHYQRYINFLKTKLSLHIE